MKKILLSIVFMLTLGAAKSKIKKGAHFTGGSLGISTQKTNADNKNYSLTISPAYGRAIQTNLIVGGEAQFSNSESEGGGVINRSSLYGVGIFIRKYKELGKGFYLFGQANLSGSIIKSSYSQIFSNNYSDRGFAIVTTFYPGVSYAINNKLHLECGLNNILSIGYSENKRQYSNSSGPFKTKNFGLASNLSNFAGLTVGVRFLLNR